MMGKPQADAYGQIRPARPQPLGAAMQSRFACFLFASLFPVAVSFPASAREHAMVAKLDELISHYALHDKFMGTVAVSKDGKLLFHKQYGIRLPGKNAPPDDQTQYRIGSITKAFTAVMIMQLIEQGKLSLDTKLSKYFPDVANAESITVGHLLGHRSGLGSMTDDPTYRDWFTDPKSREEMMEIIVRQPKVFEPGEQQRYSNSNYVLLGYILEEATGKSYADLLQTQICEPVGLKRTTYMTAAGAERNVARSFRRTGNDWQPESQTDPSVPHAAGAMMSTASDLTRFADALFGGKLISEESLDEMTPDGLGMGNGLFAFPFGPKSVYGHNGGIDGFQSSLGFFPEDKVAVAMITNGIAHDMNDIMIGVLSNTYGVPVELPNFDHVDVKVPDDVLEKYVGVYARDNFPIKVMVTRKGDTLCCQGTGQPVLRLAASSETEFHADSASAIMVFSESESGKGFDTLLLKQGGVALEFKKE